MKKLLWIVLAAIVTMPMALAGQIGTFAPDWTFKGSALTGTRQIGRRPGGRKTARSSRRRHHQTAAGCCSTAAIRTCRSAASSGAPVTARSA